MSSSDFFLAFAELDLNNTLGILTPSNPLDTTSAETNNVEDPSNLIRNSLRKAANSLNLGVIPSGNALSLPVSNAFLCWLRSNNSEMNDLMNAWAENLKYAFNNSSDLSDTDPRTNNKYMLFLEYVRQVTRRYFIRTREGALLDKFLPKFASEKIIIEAYDKFRKNYFDSFFKTLYSQTYKNLFSNNNFDGWINVSNNLQTNLLQA
ncbi:MAG TPA: hypothetical protein VN704_10735, partial [Verrucomicrobiae bacterium]|nr:hypothetical protein [Verrucomicrobiae bacterium]